jgi:S-adenosylmethionine-diacylgycerolhomoserine-N-methlytransferase
MSGEHAARMDGIYRAQRHIYDMTRKYYLLGRDRMIGELAPPACGTVLEVGCGTGRNLIAVARRWPDTALYGFDISAAMLETARKNVERARLQHRIRLAQGDATDFDAAAMFGVADFDRIFQSYTLSMIPDWRAAIKQATDHLAKDGQLHIVDFGQQERLPKAFASVLRVWLQRFDVTPRRDLFDAVVSVAEQREYAQQCLSLYRGYAWAAQIVAC